MIIIHVNISNSISDTFNMMVIAFFCSCYVKKETQHESDVYDGSQKKYACTYISLNLDSLLHCTHHNYKIYNIYFN